MSDTKAERERQIPRQIVDIQEALEKLDDASCVLRDKLAPILKDDLISPNKDAEAKDEKSLVPLATELRLICHRVNNILSTIQYLTEAREL